MWSSQRRVPPPPTPQQLKPSKVRDQRLMDLSANRLTMTADFLPTELDCSCHIVPSSSGSGLAGNVVNQNSFGKVCLSFAISACKNGSANQSRAREKFCSFIKTLFISKLVWAIKQ